MWTGTALIGLSILQAAIRLKFPGDESKLFHRWLIIVFLRPYTYNISTNEEIYVYLYDWYSLNSLFTHCLLQVAGPLYCVGFILGYVYRLQVNLQIQPWRRFRCTARGNAHLLTTKACTLYSIWGILSFAPYPHSCLCHKEFEWMGNFIQYQLILRSTISRYCNSTTIIAITVLLLQLLLLYIRTSLPMYGKAKERKTRGCWFGFCCNICGIIYVSRHYYLSNLSMYWGVFLATLKFLHVLEVAF